MNRSETFEASMKRLEEIVRKLETGDAPLEESLKLFEEGTALAAKCNQMLDQAELQVSILTQGADEKAAFTPFSAEE